MLNMSVCSFFRIPAFSFCQKRTFLIGERRRVCSPVGKNGHVKHVDANHLLGIEPTELARHSPPNTSPVRPEPGAAPHTGHETAPHFRNPKPPPTPCTPTPTREPVARYRPTPNS